MLPEALPSDRKDFVKQERFVAVSEFSSSSTIPSLGPGPGPSPGRWRESSLTSTSEYGMLDFSRWGSSNESRSRPAGHGKQGGWHVLEGSGYGYAPPRSVENIVGEDNLWARVDGKYGRSCRENRSSLNQRDWKGNSWNMSNGASHIGRPSDPSKCQQSVDDSLTHGTANCPHPDSVRSLDQLQLKEPDNNGKAGVANGFASEQRDNSLEWKPFNKWNRSGSLSSRGSGFSHSSSSKSLGGVDSGDGTTELLQTNATSVHSPLGDVATCVTSMVPSVEMTSRRKQRLGWGEGLAKYEKKKVEGPDMASVKDGAVFSHSNGDYNHFQSSNWPERSPRVLFFPECASPATPSSVACSSSLGVEEKVSGKAANIENDVSNLCGSPTSGYQHHLDGLSFNLEKLDISSIANLGCFITSLLQYFDLNSMDSGFVRSTAINKLLVMKSDTSKSLEMTECEIDSLENELKSLKFEVECTFPSPLVSSSDLSVGTREPVNSPGPSPSLLVLCEKDIVQKLATGSSALDEGHCSFEVQDVDSPRAATSMLDEPGPFSVDAPESEMVKNCEHFSAVCATVPKGMEQKSVETCDCAMEACKCSNAPYQVNSCTPASDSPISISDCDDNLCKIILASNKECASGAAEVLGRLLPVGCCQADFSELLKASFQQTNSLIREKFVTRKRFLRFKEKVLSIKFKAFHQLWKEDLHMLSIRKFRAKSEKKCELSLRPSHNVSQKHRTSIRLRLNSPAGIFSLVPTSDMLNFTSKLLADSQVQPHRDALKMPALILDRKEMVPSRYISSNGFVEDPCAVESERAVLNPWSLQEREIFIDKLAMFGKDFRKIASFLDHKTTADCVEFYYKNHKTDCFARIKKSKQVKIGADFLVAGSKRWNPEANAASLDVLSAASVIAADADNAMGIRPSFSHRILLGGCTNSRTSQSGIQTLKRKNIDLGSEREAVAADVLAGICGSLSSEALSSCITTTADFGEAYWERKCQKVDPVIKRCLTSEVSQNDDEDACSDDSSGDLDPSDWTDEEKSVFIQAMKTYGKDFLMISRCVGTRSRDQCKVFFSKARKCLGLDLIHSVPGNLATPVCDDVNGGGSDDECVTALEISSNISSDKLGTIVNPNLQPHYQSAAVTRINFVSDLNGPADGTVMGFLGKEASGSAGKLDSNASQSEQEMPVLGCGDQNIMINDIKQSDSLIVHGSPLQTINAESENVQVFEDDSCAAQAMAVEMPCRNGDVKLFGQILSNVSYVQHSNTNKNDVVDGSEAQNSVLSSKVPLRFTVRGGTEGSISQAKSDHHNQLDLESNYDMWCRTRVQSAYSSLSDSAILHSMYPPLSSHLTSSKMEQKSLQAAVISNNLNLEGVFAFHPTEMNSSRGLIDGPVYWSHNGVDGVNVHPFAIDMKRHHDTVSKRPRGNGLEVNPQQHSLGMEGMTGVGRRILVGAPCTGVTDAAVAVRRHFAKNGR